MSAIPNSRTLLVTAIATLLAVGSIADAHAQTAAERMAERRAAREATRDDRSGGAETRREAEYPQATRKDPGLTASSRLTPRLNKISEAHGAGDLATAEAEAAGILDNDRANAYERAITLRLLADLLVETDETRAMDYMRQVIELDGLSNNDHYTTMLALSQMQIGQEDYSGAVVTLDRLLTETKSDKPEPAVLRGNALYNLERYDEAIQVLEPVVKANPTRADWSQLLMATYSEAGRTAEAAALAEQIASATPGDKRAQLNLASVYLQADDYPNAIAVYERLRQAGELSEEREYSNLAALHLNTDGGEAKAIDVLNEGLEKGVLQGDYRTYSLLGQAYFFTDQTEKAIEFYGKAAPLAEDGNAYLNLAKVLANEGRDAESKAAAQKALDKGLANPEEARKLLAR